ncbi:MAG: PH domain-containing protein, partial [Actinomycetota bacterium]|nr:PH domain-containing protein [Actinomycetota bacterium]
VAAVLLVASAVTLAVEPGARGAVTATLVPGLLGSGGVLLRRLAGEWGFALTEAPDGLRLRHGLLETRSQSIPRDRVQGVRVVEPVLWRPLGWVRVEVDVAGYGSGTQEEQARTRALVPVAPRTEAQRVLDATLPGAVPGLLTGPSQALGRVGEPPRAPRPPRRALLVAPLSWRRLGVRVGEHVTATTGGVLQSVTDVVPHAKVQSLRVVQGPLQRRLRLASLHLDTAGRYVAGRAPHRDVRDADGLLAELVERTRHARGDPPP